MCYIYIDTGMYTTGDQLAYVLERADTPFFVLSFKKTNEIVGSFLGRQYVGVRAHAYLLTFYGQEQQEYVGIHL